uniref:Uncharacterized protein n=1 Tax=Anguilla anguilla TaxID=7936 RepID=A0A0E9RHI3_ANGAN
MQESTLQVTPKTACAVTLFLQGLN